MRALLRIAAIAIAGAALYFAGTVNGVILTRPDRPGAGAVVVAVGAAIGLLILAVSGTGREDAATRARRVWPMRAAWMFVCVMSLVGVAWLVGTPREPAEDWTPYHSDAIALNECATRLVLQGHDPYTDLDLFSCYAGLAIGPDRTSPLRRGLFAQDVIYPRGAELDAVWALRAKGAGKNEEFIWRPSYPALSFLVLLPVVALGADTNYLYIACLLAVMAIIVIRAPRGLRPFFLTGLLGATSLAAFTVGGSSDLLYALPLVVAWLWRERSWSVVPFGIAVATKQIAWFFAPYWMIAVATERGWRAALRDLALASSLFGFTNAPFIVHDARAWVLGVLTPLVEPMFPRGTGLVFLSTNGGLPLLPPILYAALEGLAGLVCLAVAWRARRTSPELGAVLAVVPLFFAWRSLFSYFFLLPLFAFAALARMPLGDVPVERARRLGALTIFAAPARS